MLIYLTKIEDGKTSHFRAEAINNNVAVVEGVFYCWISEHFKGCSDNNAAIAMQQQLVDEKISDGFQITEFKESLENTHDTYDKAKWHLGGDFPKDLDNFQAYVHTGMFLGWLIEKGFVSEEFSEDHLDVIVDFKNRKLTGPQLFESYCDGVLSLEDLSEIGNRFALHYFEFNVGQYIYDYEETLCGDLPSIFHVEDSWSNYEKIKKIIDLKFSHWENQHAKKPFWKFW